MKKPKLLNSQTGYDLYAQFYDKKLAYLDSFEQFHLLPNLGHIKDKKILDVGAGTGRLALRLAEKGAAVTAIDVSEKMLKILEEKVKKHFSVILAQARIPLLKENHKIPDRVGNDNVIKTIVADAENLPFPDNSFDIVVAAFLIVHLKNPKYFFSEAYRVLKSGGILAVTNINQKRPPELETKQGKIIIESYYHRPEQVIENLQKELFIIKKNILIKEKETWINQIVISQK